MYRLSIETFQVFFFYYFQHFSRKDYGRISENFILQFLCNYPFDFSIRNQELIF